MRSQRQDFGQISSTQGSPHSIRPASGMTVKSDTTRNSRYATTSDPSHSNLSFHLHHRHSSESFHFPRPPDEEIEILFEKVKQTRGDPKGLDKFTIDQKWELVKNDEQIRWKEHRIGEQSRKLHETGQSLLPQSPEWFIQKLMNRTITPKQASDLMVCLRSKEVRWAHFPSGCSALRIDHSQSWFQEFIALRGTSVLAQTLQNVSRKGSSRYNFSVSCLKNF
jgi:cytokinesis protein